MPLSNCSVNDVLVEATPLLDETLLQVVDVANPAMVDALLEHAPYLVGPRDLGQGYWAATASVRWNLVYCETKTPRCHQLGELEHCPVGKWRSLLLRNDSPAEGADWARRHGISAINFYTRLNEHKFGSTKYRHGDRDHDRFWEGGSSTQESSADTCLFRLIGIFHIGNFCFWVPILKQLLLRNCAVDFVDICNVYVGKMIIKAAKRIFNSDKICRSYGDLNFGVTFFGTVYIHTAWQFQNMQQN